jgi:hypothetical protein
MKKLVIVFCVYSLAICTGGEITSHKFTDEEMGSGGPKYTAPEGSKHYAKRSTTAAPKILFYYNRPQKNSFPIAFFCTGSSSKNGIYSALQLHRYFLQECLDSNCALITLEQRGVNDQTINVDEFWANYTRTQRLIDHQLVIKSLVDNPPAGWNGKFIFIGCSEGGPLVEQLTELYSDATVATISWSGCSGALSWRDELWTYMMPGGSETVFPWFIKLGWYLPRCVAEYFNIFCPKNRAAFDQIMDEIIKNPTFKKDFCGKTYAYQADALTWPKIDYTKLKTPYLVVSGARDIFVNSSDFFVEKAKEHHIPVTYFRVEDMDHFVLRRPDIVEKSFNWLRTIIKK